jgi:hypothetical protein
MLVHPSQLTDDHDLFRSVVEDELEYLRVITARPKTFPDELRVLKGMWEEDFLPVTRLLGDQDLSVQDFDAVWRFAKAVSESIEVKVLNVRSDDELDYSGVPKRYIVVGGNRLSRGLTLEGLSVSFFTRTANYYDTLLQMGRWFGFRPGYYDLTRIFVEKQLADLFADLARVELELRNDLRKYARQPNPPTPAELAPKIRVHPSMAVTSPMKMGAGRTTGISFQSTTQNTVNFPTTDRFSLRSNQDAGRALIRSLGRPSWSRSQEGMHIWKDVGVDAILGFLSSYTFGPRAQAVDRGPLTNYICRQRDRGELLSWDIVLPRGNPVREPFQWSEEIVTRRSMRSPQTATSIGVLQSPGDIQEWRKSAGRNADESGQASLILYLIDKTSGSPDSTFFPPPAQPEDILGFVLVFPPSTAEVTTEYVSQHLQ